MIAHVHRKNLYLSLEVSTIRMVLLLLPFVVVSPQEQLVVHYHAAADLGGSVVLAAAPVEGG